MRARLEASDLEQSKSVSSLETKMNKMARTAECIPFLESQMAFVRAEA